MVVSSSVDNHDRIFRRIYRLQRQEVCDLLYTCTYLLYTFIGDAPFFFYSSMGDALFFYTTEHVFLDPIILHTFIANFDKKILNEYYKYTYQFILHVQVFVEQSNTLTDYSL